jgi:RHS repeat-associated protein
MYVMLRKVLSVMALAMCGHFMFGQVATGTYPFGTFDNKGFDTINVGNLNVHLSIPVVNRAGRGLPFWYNLSYDASVWYPSTVSGSQTWTPVQAFGWRGDTEILTGYISYNQTQGTNTCTGSSGRFPYVITTNVVYHDPFGVAHAFGGYQKITFCDSGDVVVNTLSSTARDGSGYQLGTGGEEGGINPNGPIIDRTGHTFAAPVSTTTGAASVIDSNGNEITLDGNGHFTDTTGNIALTVSGNAPSPHTFTYKDATGTPQAVSVNYKPYTVQTDFNCSEINEYGPTPTSLVDSISFPDGSAYHFAYEPTPNGTGNVTGRLASVTLPQGGIISYSYTNGIECSDGSAVGLTRSISSDSGSAASNWIYSRSNITASTSHTDVTDGLNNQSSYDFVIPASQSNFYETTRSVNQGSSTQLLLRHTCYNTQAQSSCATAPTLTLPVTQIDTYETLDGIQQHGSTAKYNTYGLQTDEYDYDFGGASSLGGLLRHEAWTYGGSIVGLVTADQVYDGSSHLANQTNYGYDETTGTGHAALVTTSGVPSHAAASGPRGNLTTIRRYTSSSLTDNVYALSAYEDTGDALNSTSPTGSTSYSYDATHAFVSTITPPIPSSGVSLPTSIATDANTGLVSSTTDPNNTRISYPTYDSMLRPTEVDSNDSSGNMVGKTTFGYTPTQSSVYQYQNSSVHADTETQYDGHRRQSRVAIANAQSPNSWYEQDTCYDANGNVGFQSQRYSGPPWSANQAKICSGNGDAFTYDALGRVKSDTHADGTNIQYSYSGRATQIKDENGVSRITQVDGLGRTTTICEISSNNSMPGSGSPVSCGTDIAGTGFTTSYAYYLASHQTTVTQGAQTRAFQTDWLGRTISVQEPERGTTTYSYAYNSTGLVVTRQRPQANQTSAGTLTTTTTQYDALGRVLSISYTDGTPAKSFYYDQTNLFGSAISAGASKGRLTQHSASVVGNWAGEAYEYDAMGRVIATDQCLPSGCGNPAKDKWSYYTYDWLGNILSASDGGGVTTSYNNYSPDNEVGTMTSSLNDSTHPGTLVSNIVYGPFGPQSYHLGNGLNEYHPYDNQGRPEGEWVCTDTPSMGCGGGAYQVHGVSVGWSGSRVSSTEETNDDNPNRVVDLLGYDNFNRLASVTNGVNNQQLYTYVYDRYGNRWQQNVTSAIGSPFSASFNTATNQINSSGYSYDAAGNLTTDAFHTYTYDAEGNVTQVDSGGAAKYTYNALNQRVRIDQGSDAKEFVFNLNGQRSSVWDGNYGNQIQGQHYWGSQPIAYYTTAVAVPTGPSGFIFCAPENGTCSFTGAAQVAFGANGQFNYGTYTNSTSCSNSVFGDPDSGVVKACFYKLTATAPAGPSGFIYCAAENQTCNFAGEGNIAFGANGSFYYGTFTDGVSCNPADFGDPVFGTVKACFYSISTGSVHFQHQNWLGTERVRTFYNGSGEGTFTSLPFGDGFSVSGTDTDPYHFAMLDADGIAGADNGSAHAQFRQYSNLQGRWMSPDPYDGSYDFSNPQTFNRYSYVLNNPLAYIDPSGLYTLPPLPPSGGGGGDGGGDCWWCWDGGGIGSGPRPPLQPPGSGNAGGGAPSNGRNCTPNPATPSQFVLATAQVAAMTAQFFSGAGPSDLTFGPNSATSQVMAQSAGVQDALNSYYMVGQTSGLSTFGAPGYATAGVNPVAQFVGSFRWTIAPANGGINLMLTNTTSFRSLFLDIGPQWQRGFSPPMGLSTPMGNTHQTYNIYVPCKAS